jgi:hypothetical protein
MTHEELAKKIVDAAIRPTTAHEWWLQERENQLDMAKLFYGRFGNKSATMWQCLFAWATPDIWRDPVNIAKEKNT